MPTKDRLSSDAERKAAAKRRADLKSRVVLPSLKKPAAGNLMKPAKRPGTSRPIVPQANEKQLSLKQTARDAEEIKEIRTLMRVPPYAEILTNAMAPGGTTDKIEDILYNDKNFKQFASYHNKEKARYYTAELAGLGIIQHLLDDSKKPNHERITDIGFNSNGFLTIETNSRKFTYGYRKGHEDEPKITREYITGLIQRMSQQEGIDGTSFTKNEPLFNGSNTANYLRISANHPAVAPYGITMSIRVASPYLALTAKNFNTFAPMEHRLNVYNLFKILVQCHCNIMISAETGAGKTELQKLLVKFIPFQDRIIMIEDVNETHLPELYPDKDIFSWLTTKAVSITDLVKQALRNNPKWLIVAETRGAEAYEMFQGVKSDHSIITTLHSISNEAVPSRFIGMAEMGYELNEETTERDFLRYMNIGVHITKKVINGKVLRYMDELAEFVPQSKKHPDGVNVLFSQHITKDGIREFWTGEPSKMLQRKLYNERDHALSEQEWPHIPESNPRREILYPDLYKAAHNKK